MINIVNQDVDDSYLHCRISRLAVRGVASDRDDKKQPDECLLLDKAVNLTPVIVRPWRVRPSGHAVDAIEAAAMSIEQRAIALMSTVETVSRPLAELPGNSQLPGSFRKPSAGRPQRRRECHVARDQGRSKDHG